MTKQKIYDFAVKYLKLYENQKTLEHEVEEGFADQCFALGFEMDCGKAIDGFFPQMNILHDTEVFKQIVRQIEDPGLLGSAFFSKWRYITHWSYGESLLSEENRPWFIAAFTRLKELTELKELKDFQRPLLKGRARKINLVSYGMGYGPLPMPEDEVEQHLTVYEDGRVWFSAYQFGNGHPYIRGRRKQFKLQKGQADRIFAAYNQFFSTNYNEIFATDIGYWELTLTNMEGSKFRFNGSLIADFEVNGEDLSEIMREELRIENLWIFDGDTKPDRVDGITVKYKRQSKDESNLHSRGSGESAKDIYSETLRIERDSGTIEHRQKIGTDCIISRKFEAMNRVAGLLDELDADYLFEDIKEDNSLELAKAKNDIRKYIITINYKKKPQKIIQGSFDKYGLPKDWAEFASSVFRFIQSYGFGEILNPSIYANSQHQRETYTFCSIVFEEGGKTYYYIANDDSIKVGDYVFVPVGKDYHTSIVRVVDVQQYAANDVPLPVDKTKLIIRKCKPEEIE